MLTFPAIVMLGGAMLGSPATQSRATFELRGYVPVSCNASVLQQDNSSDALTLVIAERCNTSYTLQLRLPTDSKATHVLFSGREIPVRDGVVSIARTPFSGSELAGEPLSIRFSEDGAASRLQSLQIATIADSPF
jgi:hypothetical protein